MPAATKIFVSGPAALYVGTGASNALEFLGWAADGVRITPSPMYEDIHVDYLGPSIPADVLYLGDAQHIVRANMIKFDPAVLAKLLTWTPNAAFITANTVTQGAGPANGVGTLLQTEGAAVMLAVKGEYAGKSVYSTQTTFTRQYAAAYLIEPSGEIPLSTRAQVIPVVFRCLPTPQSGAQDGSYLLYSTTISAVLPTPALD